MRSESTTETTRRAVLIGVLIGVLTTLAVGVLSVAGQFVTGGSIVSLFGGVTDDEFSEFTRELQRPPAAVALSVQSGWVRIYDHGDTEGAPSVCDIPPEDRVALVRGNGQRRSVQCTIEFEEAFSSDPEVLVALSGLDVEEDINVRVGVDLGPVAETEFTFTLETWSDTRLNDARVRWLAIGTGVDGQ